MNKEQIEALEEAVRYSASSYHIKSTEQHVKTLEAAQTLLQIYKGEHELVLCEKKMHTPEHDGATGYFYYEPLQVSRAG